MITAKQISTAIENVAPLQLQEDYDNAGLQCGNINQEVKKVLCCLDVTEKSIEEAIETGCQMIVSHHPLLFHGLKSISATGDYISRCIYSAIRNNIVIYSAHTNLDNAPKGVNYKMWKMLNIKSNNITPLASIPSFRLQTLDEDFAKKCGSGIIFDVDESEHITEEDFLSCVTHIFHAESATINSDFDKPSNRPIHRIAMCGGSGSDFIRDAENQKADIYITGEIGYHRMFGHPDIRLVSIGHWESEQFTIQLLADIIKQAYPDIEITETKAGNPTRHA